MDISGYGEDKIGFLVFRNFTLWVKALRKNNSVFIRLYHILIRFFRV
jgi:hypothetical protein